MKYNESIANKRAYARVSFSQDYGNYDVSFWEKGSIVGITTGYWDTDISGNDIFEVFSEGAYNDNFYWVSSVQVELKNIKERISVKEAQKRMNDLIKNQSYILENMLVCSSLITRMEKKGFDMLEKKVELITLYNRLMERNNKIKAVPGISNVETGTEKTLTSLYADDLGDIINNQEQILNEWMKVPRVGLAVSTMIVISVLVASAFAVLVYLAFRNSYSTSKADLKKSNDLLKALQTLDPETRQKVINDLESQVDSAYARGMLDAKGENLFSNLKNIGLIGLGAAGLFFAYKKISETQYKPKKRKKDATV